MKKKGLIFLSYWVLVAKTALDVTALRLVRQGVPGRLR